MSLYAAPLRALFLSSNTIYVQFYLYLIRYSQYICTSENITSHTKITNIYSITWIETFYVRRQFFPEIIYYFLCKTVTPFFQEITY